MKYVKFRKPRGGVKREDGIGRKCLHCKRDATTTAMRRQSKFSMEVYFCDEHAQAAKDYTQVVKELDSQL